MVDESNAIRQILDKIKKLSEAKDWPGVMSEYERFLESNRSATQQEVGIFEEIESAAHHAQKMLEHGCELMNRIENLVETKEYDTAMFMADEYCKNNPCDSEAEAILNHLNYVTFKDDFRNSLNSAKKSLRERNLTSLRSTIDELLKQRGELKRFGKDASNPSWKEMLKSLDEMNLNLSLKERHLHRVEENAAVLFEQGNYQRCLEFCRDAEAISKDSKPAKLLKYQASYNITKALGADKTKDKDPDNDLGNTLRKIEATAQEYFDSQKFDLCISTCVEAARLPQESIKCRLLNQQASTILKNIKKKMDEARTHRSKKNWSKVIEVGNEILKLQNHHVKATRLIETARKEIETRRKILGITAGFAVLVVILVLVRLLVM